MKILLYISLVVLTTTSFYAQPSQDMKRDFVWKMGFSASLVDTVGYGTNTMNFNYSPTSIYKFNRIEAIGAANGSICDSIGNLLFYTNNIFIYGVDGQKMIGSDTLNPGYFSNPDFIETGYLLPFTVCILPKPNSPNLYYVIHQRTLTIYLPYVPNELYYSIVDIAAENGRGRVISSRNRLGEVDRFGDTMTFGNGKINACRHANGRDWWVLQWAADYSWYYTFLLTPNGMQDYGKHIINTPLTQGIGQAVFSPDGSKYVTITLEGWQPTHNTRGRVDIYDFDRCNGILNRSTQPFLIEQTGIGNDTMGTVVVGASISPNNRYLYVTSKAHFYQYDLASTNIPISRVLLAEYDGFTDPTFPYSPTHSFAHQLAPDGKIYICNILSTHYLHVINNPDVGGIGCNLQQHSVYLPAFNFRSVPNHPHFRLGALAGSTCDTLNVGTTKAASIRHGMALFPNPTTESTRLIWYESLSTNANITITNSIGQVVQHIAVSKGSTYQDIELKALPNGIYFVTFYNQTLKLIKSE